VKRIETNTGRQRTNTINQYEVEREREAKDRYRERDGRA
jgi:hypothetical protein